MMYIEYCNLFGKAVETLKLNYTPSLNYLTSPPCQRREHDEQITSDIGCIMIFGNGKCFNTLSQLHGQNCSGISKHTHTTEV